MAMIRRVMLAVLVLVITVEVSHLGGAAHPASMPYNPGNVTQSANPPAGVVCNSTYCQNGGRCVAGPSSVSCSCAVGFIGTRCQTNADECSSKPCENGGTCIDGVNAYRCTCAAGYTDTNCHTNIDECAPNPCVNGGICIDGVNDYTCICPATHTGQNCQTVITPCGLACVNGATCVGNGNTAKCQCTNGFAGTLCQLNIDECAPNPCVNGGTCIDGVNDYTCTCPATHTGQNCQTVITPCGLACVNGATCVRNGNRSKCHCTNGFAGTFCQLNCTYEATCQSCVKSEECICKGEDFDAPTTKMYHPFKGVCNAYLQCVRIGTPGNFEVTYIDRSCANGTLWHDAILACDHYYNSDLTLCKACSSKPCENGGTCTDQVWSNNGMTTSVGFKCKCPTGFTGMKCQTAG